MQKGRFYPQMPQRVMSLDMAYHHCAPRRLRFVGTIEFNSTIVDCMVFPPTLQATVAAGGALLHWDSSAVVGGILISSKFSQERNPSGPGIIFTYEFRTTGFGLHVQQRLWEAGQLEWGNPFFEAGVMFSDVYTGSFGALLDIAPLPELYY